MKTNCLKIYSFASRQLSAHNVTPIIPSPISQSGTAMIKPNKSRFISAPIPQDGIQILFYVSIKEVVPSLSPMYGTLNNKKITVLSGKTFTWHLQKCFFFLSTRII
jgi:hypothetical protein